MEEANVNVNWIAQMLGRELVNCRGAYSKPSDEQLENAYRKGYEHIRVIPKIEPIQKEASPQIQVTNTETEKNPIYLETQKEKNVNFYEKYAFSVRKKIILPEPLNLPMWLMVRDVK